MENRRILTWMNDRPVLRSFSLGQLVGILLTLFLHLTALLVRDAEHAPLLLPWGLMRLPAGLIADQLKWNDLLSSAPREITVPMLMWMLLINAMMFGTIGACWRTFFSRKSRKKGQADGGTSAVFFFLVFFVATGAGPRACYAHKEELYERISLSASRSSTNFVLPAQRPLEAGTENANPHW